MAITKGDLKLIGNLLDEKLDEKFVDHLALLEKRIDERMGRRFDGIDERLDGIDERLDGIDERLDGIDERFGSVQEFIDFAKPAIEVILDESQTNFEKRKPQRVLRLDEALHLTFPLPNIH